MATKPHHMCREERVVFWLLHLDPLNWPTMASLDRMAIDRQWFAALPRFRLRRTGMSDNFAPGREPKPLPHHLGLQNTREGFRSMGHSPLLYDAWPGPERLGT